MENKYKVGETVYAKTEPEIKLTIRRYIDRIYYCRVQANPEEKEKVYFERELMDATEIEKNKIIV